MSEQKRNRAAVVLFVDSETVTGPDISNILRHALYKNGTLRDGLTAIVGGVEHHIRIVDVMDAGMAAGNGYLWTEPTAKSWQYHEHNLGDKGILHA